MKRHLIPVLLIPTVLAVIAIFAVWTQIIPKYKAKAEIRVRPIVPYLVFQTEDNGMIPYYDSFVNTQVSIISCPIILLRVLDNKEIQNTNWYKNPEESLLTKLSEEKKNRLERLRDSLSVTPRRQTEIIDVSFAAQNANDAKLIVNSVLDAYRKYIHDVSNVTEYELYSELVKQYKSLESEIDGRKQVIEHLSSTIGTKTPGELISNQRVRLDQTRAKLTDIQREIAILEWQLKEPNNIALLEPEVSKAKLEFQLAQSKYEKQLLSSELNKQSMVLNELFVAVQNYEAEDEQLKRKLNLFEAVQKRLDQKNMERNVPVPIEVLSSAFVPSKPYNDNRILFTVIISILWLCISALIIAVFRIPSGRANKNEIK